MILCILFLTPLHLFLALDLYDGGVNQCQSDSEWEEHSDGNRSMLKLDDWINFCVDGEAGHLAFQLRQKWNATFLRRMRSPSKAWNPVC